MKMWKNLFFLVFMVYPQKNEGLWSSAFLSTTSEKLNILDLEVSQYDFSFKPKTNRKKNLAPAGLGDDLADPLLNLFTVYQK
jgi:hypothetical protein